MLLLRKEEIPLQIPFIDGYLQTVVMYSPSDLVRFGLGTIFLSCCPVHLNIIPRLGLLVEHENWRLFL